MLVFQQQVQLANQKAAMVGHAKWTPFFQAHLYKLFVQMLVRVCARACLFFVYC